MVEAVVTADKKDTAEMARIQSREIRVILILFPGPLIMNSFTRNYKI